MSDQPDLAARPAGHAGPIRSGLTADLCARAIIAAARSYGDCPLAAMTSRNPQLKRSRTAAGSGLARVGVTTIPTVARVLGLGGQTIDQARWGKLPAFVAAEASARRAVDYALEALRSSPSGGGGPLKAVEGVSSPASGRIAPSVTAQVVAAARLAPRHLPQTGAERARVLTAGKVRREVLACLGEEPCTGPELMALVGVGEGQVREALLALKDAGQVRSTALTAEGWSAQTWALA